MSGSARQPAPAGRRRLAGLLALSAAVVVVLVVVVGSTVGGGSPARHRSSGSHHSTPARDPHGAPGDPTTAASAAGTALDPSTFAPGACVAFSPTSGNRHQTVFLDAGHGGVDPGALGTTESGAPVHEADETLPVALDAASILRAHGFRVVVSRTTDSTVMRPGPGDLSTGVFTLQGEHDDVAARDVCANLSGATVLLGIYFDAGTSPTNAGSITGYDAVRSFAADNQRLATLLQADVLAQLDAKGWTIPDDGVVPDTTLGGPAPTTAAADYHHLLLLGPADPGWFTTPSRMPGALIEPLFITDPYEGTIAASAAGQHAIARGMAKAAQQYLGSGNGSSKGNGRSN